MTFLEAALEILKRERKPLHYKELTERAMERKLLTFVGRTPEVTMQTQLTNAVKKAAGAPFVRVKPGIFGLLRYPEAPLEPEPEVEAPKAKDKDSDKDSDRAKDRDKTSARPNGGSGKEGEREAHGRRRRRGGRGKGRREPTQATVGAQGVGESRPGGEMTSDETESPEDRERDGAEAHEGPDEPEIGSMSPEARAAALAETGVLESHGHDDGDSDGDGDGDEDEEPQRRNQLETDDTVAATSQRQPETDEADQGDQGDDDDEDSDDDDDDEPAGPEGVAATGAPGEARPLDETGPGRRRRRRRRRRRGGENGLPEFGGGLEQTATSGGERVVEGTSSVDAGTLVTPSEPTRTFESGPAAAGPEAASDAGAQAGRRVMSPIDAAIEILKGQAPGRGVHVRQIADAAVRRRLVHGEPNEAWRVMRAALAAEPRERLRAGLRPRVRPAGSGLYALARRPPDMDLERAEYVFGEGRRALRERTLAGLEQRLSELTPSAFEAVARVLLQREGFGPATFVKRVEGTIYLEALRGRGSRPSRCLIAMRPGSGAGAGRRAIGELRAGIRARTQDEGLLMLASRLGEEAIAEWRQPGPPVEVVDGAAMAETCIRHGVGVINATISVDFVDADFFAEIAEG
jgi:hypothetical protein